MYKVLQFFITVLRILKYRLNFKEAAFNFQRYKTYFYSNEVGSEAYAFF